MRISFLNESKNIRCIYAIPEDATIRIDGKFLHIERPRLDGSMMHEVCISMEFPDISYAEEVFEHIEDGLINGESLLGVVVGMNGEVLSNFFAKDDKDE